MSQTNPKSKTPEEPKGASGEGGEPSARSGERTLRSVDAPVDPGSTDGEAAAPGRKQGTPQDVPGPKPQGDGPRKPGPKQGNPQNAAGAKPQGGPAQKPGSRQGGRPQKPGPKPGGNQKPEPVVEIRPLAGPARSKRRHWGLLLSFLLMVCIPAVAVGSYLYSQAVDQYASNVGFSVRKEEIGTAVEILGGITNLSGSSSTDTDILYEFIQSQEMVTRIDNDLDLREMYSVPDADPVFTFDPSGSTEDLVEYWNRMVRISYDAGTGLIELRVLAFQAQDAQDIARAIFDECSRMINELSRIAREDATRYASEELEQSVERLKRAREALTSFRSRTQIVDPSADVQGQVGLLNTLQQQLAEALIEFDLLNETARENDPRLSQTERRIEVIRNRIAQERQKFGKGGQNQPGGEDYATLVEEFERLSVDREFAEQAYTAALSTYDSAKAEAQRQSRYLAAYVKPTLPDEAQYPQRLMLLGLATMFAFLAWAILALIYYSVRDRR